MEPRAESINDNASRMVIVVGPPPQGFYAWYRQAENKGKRLVVIGPGREILESSEWSGFISEVARTSVDHQVFNLHNEGRLETPAYYFLARMVLEENPDLVQTISPRGAGPHPLLQIINDFFLWYLGRQADIPTRIKIAENFVLAYAHEPLHQEFYNKISALITQGMEKPATPFKTEGPWRWAILYEQWPLYLPQAESIQHGLEENQETGLHCSQEHNRH